MPSTRRDVLRSSSAVLGAAVAGAATGIDSVSAKQTEFGPRTAPSSVFVEYDEAWLRTYRPLLDIPEPAREEFEALHGFKVTSDDYKFDFGVYACEYSKQEGWLGSLDSHDGDHEWIYVLVDSTGAVAEVIYAAYHWLAGRATGTAIPLYDGTHPAAHVNETWHQYALDPQKRGTLQEVADLTEWYPAWLRNGLHDPLAPRVVLDPARMRSRGSWWRDSSTATTYKLYYTFGVAGADAADQPRDTTLF